MHTSNTNPRKRRGGRILLPLGLLLAVLLAACTQVRLPDTTPEISFTAQPKAITAGETSTLSWEVKDADSVVLLPSGDPVDAAGTRKVSPETTTDYTLRATNRRGISEETVTIQVRQPEDPPVIGEFRADPNAIGTGESSTLHWQVAGAHKITISPVVGEVTGASGSRVVTPDSTTRYTLTASNAYGTTTATATLTVNGGASDGDGRPLVAGFHAEPEGITRGEHSTISWDVEGATSITILPEIGKVGADGRQDVRPEETTTYTLRAANSQGVTTRSVTVFVRESEDSAPLVARFSASPSSVTHGGVSTLSWSVVGANSVTISPDIGAVAAAGSRTVRVDRNVTYTLTATNAHGTTERTASITVQDDSSPAPVEPAVAVFLADPASGRAPFDTTFHWVITDPDNLVSSVELLAGDRSGTVTSLPVTSGSHDHTYAREGIYTALLLLRLEDGSLIQRSTTVGVSGSSSGSGPEITRFSASPARGRAPLNVTFEWELESGSGLTCVLNAGDDSASEEITDCTSGSFRHSYSRPGVYTPSITVEDAAGNISQTATTVTVFPGADRTSLIADFSAEPAEGDLPLPVAFSWTLSGSADTWLFLGDGSDPLERTGTQGDSSHTYTAGGTFGALLLAVDSEGNADVAVTRIRVTDPSAVPTAFVRTGSTLLSLSEAERGLLPPLLGTLLGSDADLTVLDNEALLNTDVSLLGLLETLALNVGAAGPEAVLLGAIDLHDIVEALLDLVTGTAAAVPLQDLVGQLPALPLPLELGELLALDDLSDLASLRHLNLQVLDVLVLALQLFDSQNVAATPHPIELGLTGADGLLNTLGLGSLVEGTLSSGSLARVYLQVVEPPVLTVAREDRLGPVHAGFRSAGVRLAVELEGLGLSLDLDRNSAPTGLLDGLLSLVTGLLGALDLVTIDLNLTLTELTVFAEVGALEGHVTSIDSRSETVVIESAGSVARLALGSINRDHFFDRSRTAPAELDFGTIATAKLGIDVRLLGGSLAGANADVGIMAKADSGATSAGRQLSLGTPFPASGSIPSQGAGALIDGLLADLDLELDVRLSTSGAFGGLLKLDNLLGPLMSTLTELLDTVLGLADGATNLGTRLPLEGLLNGLLDNTVFRVLGLNLNETEVTVLDLLVP